MPQVFLAIAIACEIAATSLLPETRQFSRLVPSLAVLTGYGLAIYFLTHALTAIPVGVAYAIWSGLGVAGIAAIGAVFYGQRLDLPAILGMAMIVGGVLVLQLFSDTAGH